MRVLTPENSAFSMDTISEKISEDIKYCVLDYSNASNGDADFYFLPLIFLDVFPRPAADLQIGPYRIQVPLDWSIMIADKNFGYLEIIELKHLNDRSFDAFVFNPIGSYIPDFHEITMLNIYSDVSWSVPRLKYSHLLAVPLTGDDNPPCIYIVKEHSKLPESLDITKIL